MTFLFRVIPAGFEPTTHSLEGCCSIQLSYGTDTACVRVHLRCKSKSFISFIQNKRSFYPYPQVLSDVIGGGAPSEDMRSVVYSKLFIYMLYII